MIDTIEFTIKATKNEKEEEISFKNEYNEEGECTDAYSFNPTQGWVGYTQFDSNWSEEDEDLNELLRAIHDYSTSMECADLVGSTTTEEIRKTYTVQCYCDGQVHNNAVFDFKVTIDDVY